jgi:hypothetical protein
LLPDATDSMNGGALCEDIIYTGDWPMCGDALTNRSGLVYGFGIEKNWDFEAAAGALGFEVRPFARREREGGEREKEREREMRLDSICVLSVPCE